LQACLICSFIVDLVSRRSKNQIFKTITGEKWGLGKFKACGRRKQGDVIPFLQEVLAMLVNIFGNERCVVS